MKKVVLFIFITISLLKGELNKDDIFKVNTANIYKQINEYIKVKKILNNSSNENPDSKYKFLKEECNKNNNAVACAVYGEYLFEKKGIKQLGESYIKKSCDLNNEVGCAKLLQLKEKYEKNYNNKELLDKLCKIGNQPDMAGYGCFMLAKKYLETKGKTQQGLNYLKRACFLKHQPSCYVLGILYYKGLSTLPKDDEKAKKYIKKACDLGYERACVFEIKMYAENKQIKQNEQRVLSIAKRTCDEFNNPKTCFIYAMIKLDDIVSQNKNTNNVSVPSEIVNYFQKSCNLGLEKACEILKSFK